MTDTILTATQRNHLLSLRHTMELQEIASQRLSTGLKVNSAMDNPSAFYSASELNNRASTLNRLMDGMSQGIQTIKTAQDSIENAIAFLEQAKSVANQALEYQGDGSDTSLEAVTKVATKQELLDAVNNWQTGDDVIVITENISFGLNETLDLSDKNGIKIVGENYITGNQERATLSFNFDSSIQAVGIEIGANSLISDLQIDYFTETKTDNNNFHAIRNDGNQGVVLNNLTINSKTSNNGTDLTYLVAGIGNINKAQTTITGDVTLNSVGGTRVMGVYGDVGTNESTLIVDKDASLNFTSSTHGSNGIYRGKNQIDGTLNISTSGSYGNAIAYGNTTITGNVNIKTTGSGASGFIYGNYNLSSTANVMMQTFGSGMFEDYSRLPIVVDYEAGATIGMYHNSDATAGIWQANTSGKIESTTTTLNGNSNFDKQSSFPQDEFEKTITDAFKGKEYSQSVVISDYDYSNFENQFNQILEQFDNMIGDSSYKGINLLEKNNQLNIIFDEDGSSKLTIDGVDSSTSGLGISAAKWANAEDINYAISQLTKAAQDLQSTALDFDNQTFIINNYQKFNENMSNILKEGAAKLVEADIEEEAANLAALQVRELLASKAMNIAAESQRNVLLLFDSDADTTISQPTSNVVSFQSK